MRFTDVSFAYRDDRPAIRKLSLAIPQGQYVCLLGANGSGKSTFARLLNGLLLPQEGEVRVAGLSTADAKHTYALRSQVGLVFQNPDDQIVATLVENEVAFGPENLGLPSREIRRRVDAALAEVGLDGFQTRQTTALSGGQKQRLAIADALAMEPSILVLDEATAMLDPAGRASFLRTVERLHDRDMTILMITHHMDEALRAERVIILADGTVAADGKPEDVLVDGELLTDLGLEPPFPVRLREALLEHGIELPATVNETELKEALCRLRSTR